MLISPQRPNKDSVVQQKLPWVISAVSATQASVLKMLNQVCLEELHCHQLSKLKSIQYFWNKILPCTGCKQVRKLDLMLAKGLPLAIFPPLSSCFRVTTVLEDIKGEQEQNSPQIMQKLAINSPHSVLWNNIWADKSTGPLRLTLAVTYCATESSKCILTASTVHRGLNLATCKRGSAGESKTALHAGPFRSIPNS